MITMVLGGLWHGASWNFVVWGAVHGAGLALERAIGLHRLGGRAWAAVAARTIATFHLVCFAWIFFRAETFAASTTIVARIATCADGATVTLAPLFVLAALLAGQRWMQHDNHILRFLDAHPTLARWSVGIAVVLLVSLLARQPSPDFLYFQF